MTTVPATGTTTVTAVVTAADPLGVPEGPLDGGAALAALGRVPAARVELDRAEARLIGAARAAGTPWSQIATALGLGSYQAAAQRAARLAASTGHPTNPDTTTAGGARHDRRPRPGRPGRAHHTAADTRPAPATRTGTVAAGAAGRTDAADQHGVPLRNVSPGAK